METLYVVYEATKLGMMPTAYSSNKKTAESFARRGRDTVVLSKDAEKIEQLLKKLKIKNLDI
jgi:hypothetical protein